MLSSELEYLTVRQKPALQAEAGLPQMYSLVSRFHKTMLRQGIVNTGYVLLITCSVPVSARFIRALYILKPCSLPVIIYAPKRNQVLVTGREGNPFHLSCVEKQLGIDCSLCKIPDNHWCLETGGSVIGDH